MVPLACVPDSLEPQRIAPETFVLRELHSLGDEGALYVSSLLVRGPEPVLVDTGTAVGGAARLAALAALVDPADVRWLVLSHDDPDHAGLVPELLEACPDATVVLSPFTAQRLAAALDPARCRLVGDGDTVPAGDRGLRVVTPPIVDAPGSIGVLDDRTGVLWAADAFATPVPGPVDDVAALAPAAWAEGAVRCARVLTPWHGLLDPAKWSEAVDAVRALAPAAIASAHAPLIRASQVDAAIGLLHSLPRRAGRTAR